ncbi:neural cell adhesion molecule 2-like [Oratosquilla oratoria]|uniref:neural cell adhesion molecule 2-like n=1 Tax=Oratosquilla oratoria TaxID=337810 RepID=UPI003F75E7ED
MGPSGSFGHVNITQSKRNDFLHKQHKVLTTDPRIYPLHEVGSPYHDLRISKLRINDSAIYKCETSTDPPLAAEIRLIVIETYSVIFGSPEMRVRKGETLYLLCLVLEVVDVPEYMIWYRDGHVIDYSREDVTVTVDDLTCSSELQVRNVSEKDVGLYTCAPSNAPPADIKVSLITLGHKPYLASLLLLLQ